MTRRKATMGPYYCCLLFLILTRAAFGQESAINGTNATNATTTPPTSEIGTTETYNFAVIAKNVGNPFFDEVRQGCESAAENLNVTCLYTGPDEDNATTQAQIINQLVDSGNVSGIAVSVLDNLITGDAINRAVTRGIPVVTYDSDAPKSLRTSYIGTNNWELGHSFAWLLGVSQPNGGKYALISSDSPNTNQRVEGVRYKLSETFGSDRWVELGEGKSPTNCQDSTELALDQLEELGRDNPDLAAIVSVGGWPMFDTDTTRWKAFVDAHPEMLLFVGDSLPVQLELLDDGYVNGLVGQKPIRMGELSIDTLLKIVMNETVDGEIYTGEDVLLSPGKATSRCIDGLGTTTSDGGLKKLLEFSTLVLLLATSLIAL